MILQVGSWFAAEPALAVHLPSPTRWVYAPAHVAHTDGVPIDVHATNADALARLVERRAERPAAPLLVVPGYTPVDAKQPVRLSDPTRARLEAAVRALAERQALGILVTGGNVHPADTPYNEAWEMRAHLLGPLGVPADRVLLEPYARHSTTNLRNAGRLLRAYDIGAAVIVTDFAQGFYFGAPTLSTFSLRCRAELGYSVGELDPDPDFRHVRFVPGPRVIERGEDALDP